MENITLIIIIIINLLLLLEIIFKPRIDFEDSNKVFLWYGKRNRRYYVLYEKR